MKSRNLLFIAVTGVLTGWLPAADAQQKYLVLSNEDKVEGTPAPVPGYGEKATIPLSGAAQIDGSGNIIVNCYKGAAGTDPCPNIGTAGSGSGDLTLPNFTSSLTATITTSAQLLSWEAANARTCYGVDFERVSGPTAQAPTGWLDVQPTARVGVNRFNISGLQAAVNSANNTGQYKFTLRCYSNAEVPLGVAGEWGAGARDSVATVELSPQSTGGGGGTQGCTGTNGHYTNLSTSEKEHYDKYDAIKREFSILEKTFSGQTNSTLGQSDGSLPGATPGLPGVLSDTQVLALSFTLAAGQKFGMVMTEGAGGVNRHDVVMTISPCPGDFRPPIYEAGAPEYQGSLCRVGYGTELNLRGAAGGMAGRCSIPAGQKMYLNVSLRNLYLEGGKDSIPADFCLDNAFCGVFVTLSN